MGDNVIRIPHNSYIHVLDNNENTQRLEIGPQTFIRREHELIVEGPTKMLNLPPRTFCKILNPVLRNEKGQPVEVQQGEIEYRTADDYPDPFPLYPGEKLDGKVENLVIVQQNTALRFIAVRDFKDGKVNRIAGEEWQRVGPFTAVPRIEEQVINLVKAIVIKPNTALRLKALRQLTDRKGVQRKAGEEWLIRENGSYLPDTYESQVELVNGYLLTDKQCLHLRATREFVDFYGTKRLPGQEWLITNKLASVHIKDVYEEVVNVENAITLTSRQYCVIINPFNQEKNTNMWGTKVLVKGEKTLFLRPGEYLENGQVQQVRILSEEEALLLQATQDFEQDGQFQKAGNKWIIRGPREYIPPVGVIILEGRKCIPLDANEGIYVRDQRTGEVREVKGKTHLLEAHETLWEKHLPETSEALVARASSGAPYVPPKVNEKGQLIYDQSVSANAPKRDKTRIISFKAPHNSAIQLYDYKLKKQRVVFGPDLVMLGPDEQFTVLSLSGSKPKKENLIQTLQLSLGPDFMTDQIIVETSDHAKLALTLSYNWHFQVDKEDQVQASKLFAVKDFVGDACKNIASRVRGAVSSISFEDFHHNSSLKIKEAVFGRDKETNLLRSVLNQIKIYEFKELKFDANSLIITSVDIQGQEITDEKTRKQLAQSINLAIEISSKGQEMNSRHQATKLEQEAKGQLDRQKLDDITKQEETKIKLLEQQAESARVKAEGDAIAQAIAESIQTRMNGEAEVNRVQLKVQAIKIEQDAELEQLKNENDAEVQHQSALIELEIKKARELSEIEINKFSQLVKAIGKETIIAMAKAGPETKAKLLSGLGLKGYLVTDGKNPINLFNTANGFMGGAHP